MAAVASMIDRLNASCSGTCSSRAASNSSRPAILQLAVRGEGVKRTGIVSGPLMKFDAR